MTIQETFRKEKSNNSGSHDGAASSEAKSIANGSYGATHSQKIPAIIMAQMMAKLMAPSGC